MSFDKRQRNQKIIFKYYINISFSTNSYLNIYHISKTQMKSITHLKTIKFHLNEIRKIESKFSAGL